MAELDGLVLLKRSGDGQVRACYAFDLAGTLVYIPDPFEELAPNGSWPRGSRVADLSALFPRATTAAQAYQLLLGTIKRAFTPPLPTKGASARLSSCYPGGRPQQKEAVFFPYIGTSEPDDYYAEIIREVDAQPGAPASLEAERLLAAYGVYRIPPLKRVSPLYHEGKAPEGTPIAEIVSSGWVRDGRVLIKAKVSTVVRTV